MSIIISIKLLRENSVTTTYSFVCTQQYRTQRTHSNIAHIKENHVDTLYI